MSDQNIIAITGYGSLSALGTDEQTVWQNYLSQQHFLTNKIFNHKTYPVGALHASAQEELQTLSNSNKRLNRLDKTSLMAIVAASKAVKQAGWGEEDKISTGVITGSSRGTTGLFEMFHEEYLNQENHKTQLLTSPLTTLGNPSSEVASYISAQGPVIFNSVTCSTALQSVANAMAWIKSEMGERFIVGASEAPLTKFTLAQTEALGIYTTDVDVAYPSRPFSSAENHQNTFALGEGAAMFALEEATQKTLKKSWAVIESIGYSFHKPPSATGISEDGAVLSDSMKMALGSMQTPQPIDLLLMHGTGTVKGDMAEMNAIRHTFGNQMPSLFTNKWKVGHTYGASAALHIELALLCLKNNTSPVMPYPVAISGVQTKQIKKVMINATGFGGNAMTLILSTPALYVQ